MSHKNMENEKYTTAPGFSVNKYVLTAVGQWPYQSKWQRSITRIIGNSIMIVANLSSFIAMYDTRDDFDAVIERIPMCMTGVFYFINFLTLVTQTSKMRILLDDVKQNFKVISKNFKEEKEILMQAADEGRFVIFLYCFLLGSSTLLYCLVALVPLFLDFIAPLNESRTRNYVYDVNYVIFDKEQHYYFIFCHSTIAGIYCIATVTAFDIMLYGFVKHITGMFRVLGHRLKNILSSNKIYLTITKNDYRKIESETMSCVKLYNDIIVFTNNVESCFATCLTFTMGVSAMILCFQGVMIVVRIDEPDFVMRFSTNFVAQAIHLFYNCFTGQMLMSSSDGVTNSIYDSHWYLMPLRQQKILSMMMLRSIKDCNVTIGKFFILNNQTYTNLMKTVFSYLSVLSSVRE